MERAVACRRERQNPVSEDWHFAQEETRAQSIAGE